MEELFDYKAIFTCQKKHMYNTHYNNIIIIIHYLMEIFVGAVLQVVKAGENEWTTFDVVFLPRTPGHVRDTLYIHTSHGTFDLKVSHTVNPFLSVCEIRTPL